MEDGHGCTKYELLWLLKFELCVAHFLVKENQLIADHCYALGAETKKRRYSRGKMIENEVS